MSLTSFVDQSHVRRGLRLAIAKPKYKFDLPMLAPPLTTNYSTVGTAFDYLLRFHIERINRNVNRKIWIAKGGFACLSEEVSQKSRLFKLARLRLDEAEHTYSEYIRTGEVTDDLLIGALYLARLDVIFRAGAMYAKREDFEAVDALDIEDLRALMKLVKRQKFKAKKYCILNPSFGWGSQLVGGADADLIIDDCLIDIKTTKNLELSRKHFNQLLGYYILLTLVEKPDVEDACEINRIGIYFSRHGYLHIIPFANLIDSKSYSDLVKWFVEMACPSKRERIFYYRNFTWPPCQEWLRELQDKRRQERVAYIKNNKIKRQRKPI